MIVDVAIEYSIEYTINSQKILPRISYNCNLFFLLLIVILFIGLLICMYLLIKYLLSGCVVDIGSNRLPSILLNYMLYISINLSVVYLFWNIGSVMLP